MQLKKTKQKTIATFLKIYYFGKKAIVRYTNSILCNFELAITDYFL